MSTEIVRRTLDTLNDESVEAALPFFHEEFCGVVPPDLSAEPDEYRGHDGVLRYVHSFQEIVEDLRFDAEKIVEVGEDGVVALAHITGRGRESGIPIEMRVPMVMRLRDGKLVKMTGYREWDDAVAAAEAPS